MHWQRILFLVSLAIVEVAPAALLVTLAGGNVWLLLFGVALIGALVGRLSERLLPEHADRPATLAIGLLLGVVSFAAVSGAGLNVVGALAQASSFAYLTLLATVYVFWRGTRLAEHDSVTVGRFFNRAMIVIFVILMLGALGSALGSSLAAIAGWELLSFFGGGLLAIALAHMASDQGNMQQIEWRGVATLAATIIVVMIGGILVASLFGGFALSFLGGIVQAIGFVIALLLAPFAFALAWVLQRLVVVLGDLEAARIFAQQAQQLSETGRRLSMQGEPPAWVGVVLNTLCFVVPLIALAAIILLRRRRARTVQPENEQRESLLSWQGVSNDLRDLFGLFRNRSGEAGLQAALARLAGNDPASRIRRAYIRLLLHAEARERTRAVSQTPHEFVSAAASATQARQQVETLTSAYERARYAPGTATQFQAEQAEQAWKQIENNT